MGGIIRKEWFSEISDKQQLKFVKEIYGKEASVQTDNDNDGKIVGYTLYLDGEPFDFNVTVGDVLSFLGKPTMICNSGRVEDYWRVIAFGKEYSEEDSLGGLDAALWYAIKDVLKQDD